MHSAVASPPRRPGRRVIVEAVIYGLSLPNTPREFRQHLFDAVGLWSRGRRQAAAWAPHLRATRSFLAAEIAGIERRGTVAVLGSGPLFDVPLEALAEAFDEVLLVDLAHLFPVARRLRRHRNVRRLWADLAAAPLAAALGSRPDWVISANLLSQLALGAPEDGAVRVVAAHLDDLAALDVPATLVTDTSYRVLDRAGRERSSRDLLHGCVLPAPDTGWQWEVAPFGEEAGDTRRVHSVAAWRDLRSHAMAGKAFIRCAPPDRLQSNDPVAQPDRAQDS